MCLIADPTQCAVRWMSDVVCSGAHTEGLPADVRVRLGHLSPHLDAIEHFRHRGVVERGCNRSKVVFNEKTCFAAGPGGRKIPV